jgi:hypothetical protein
MLRSKETGGKPGLTRGRRVGTLHCHCARRPHLPILSSSHPSRWIHDWTVFHHDLAAPLTGELWLLLIQFACKIKRADEIMPKIWKNHNREMVEDFLESGERLCDGFSYVVSNKLTMRVSRTTSYFCVRDKVS